VRRMVMLLTIALFMTLVAALSASAVFASPPAAPQLLPPQAFCGTQEAESHAPDQADAQIPAAEPSKCRVEIEPIPK
jgi:hypothetical protein